MTEHEYCVVHDLASVRGVKSALHDITMSEQVPKEQLREVHLTLNSWLSSLEEEVERLSSGEES